MKVIDLYKLIANKEYDKLPEKIMLKGYDYIFSLREDCSGYKWYGEVNTHNEFEETIPQNLEFILNCEIIIFDKIEEKKIPEEIKENLKYCYEDSYISEEEYKRQIDYITNLQQDIENYVKITLHDRKEINRLNKEIERLNNEIKELKGGDVL